MITYDHLCFKLKNFPFKKAKDFAEFTGLVNHNNPAAILNSTLKVYNDYTLEKCYSGNNVFWASDPMSNATHFISFKFKEPELLQK
jgi:hypothetical protein